MEMQVKGDKLVITIDVSKAARDGAPLSKSGKSRVVASTNGFAEVANGLKLGLNLITK